MMYIQENKAKFPTLSLTKLCQYFNNKLFTELSIIPLRNDHITLIARTTSMHKKQFLINNKYQNVSHLIKIR